ncbi:MBL fold metallo-hydrolase [Jonesiaceae bacterium BS-20]|uniref:MBL fold metallo-hydrolase n=1 Tax=Jonesiaceae bacterium BS-20 TaxID=3120821 RepID=A0AAU7DYR7_9MICO
MKLTVVGMSGSYAGPESPASSYLVQATDADGKVWSVVLDMGSGAFGALQRHIDPFAVDAIALSHLHPDHCSDLSGFYVYYKYHPDKGTEFTDRGPIPVFAPTDAGERICRAYGLPEGETMEKELAHSRWECRAQVEVGPFQIQAVTVNHPVEAYGFRITGPSEFDPNKQVVLAYSGDTDVCEGLDVVAKDADLFLCEAAFVEGRDDGIQNMHLTGKRAGEVARDAGSKHLVLTHIPSWNDPEVTLAEAKSVYFGQLSVAAPDQTYAI